jgi:ATP-dependent Clp protease adaptor protein ClpS
VTKPKGHEEGEVLTRKRGQLKTPRLYRVLLHNDHYTTMEFVVFVLERIFRKSEAEAQAIMLAVHKQGIGIAGVFTRDLAETKVAQVKALAEKEGYPLKCSSEPEP